MRAIVDRDVIVRITQRGNTDIGRIPKGVGLERLRWDGSKVVDLADLTEMWVEEQNGAFILHAVKVPGSQLVQMTYADRKRLTKDPDGTIRVKTDAELQAEAEEQQTSAKVGRLDKIEARLVLLGLVDRAGLITLPPKLKARFNDLVAKINNVLGG